MNINTMRTMSSCTLLERTSMKIKDSVVPIVSNTAHQGKEQFKNTAESATVDRETAKVVQYTKRASDPIVIVALSAHTVFKQQRLIHAFEKRYNGAVADRIQETLRDQNVFLEKGTDNVLTGETFLSSSYNLDEVFNKNIERTFNKDTIDDIKKILEDNSIELNPELLKTLSTNKGLQDFLNKSGDKLNKNAIKDLTKILDEYKVFQFNSVKLKIYDAEKASEYYKWSEVALKRMGVCKRFTADGRLLKRFEKDSKKISKITNKKSTKLKNAKKITKSIRRLLLSPLDQSEVMKGYRLGVAMSIPVKSLIKLMKKMINKVGYSFYQRRLMSKIFRMNPELSKADARRCAKRIMKKRFGNSKNFFSKYARRHFLEGIQHATRNSTWIVGQGINQIVSIHLNPNGMSKKAVKKATKAAKKGMKKGLRKAGKRLIKRTFKLAMHVTKFAIRISMKLIQVLIQLITKLIIFLISAISSLGVPFLAGILCLILIISPVITIITTYPAAEKAREVKKVQQAEWTTVCSVVKKGIAQYAKAEGYTAKEGPNQAYSQTGKALSIKINDISYEVRRDCSGYVSACLYYYGAFTNKGQSWCSRDFVTKNELTGFKKMSFNINDLQEGDIIAYNGHVEIFDKEKWGKYYVWSNGSSKSILNEKSNCYENNRPVHEKNPMSMLRYKVIWRPTGNLTKAETMEDIRDFNINEPIQKPPTPPTPPPTTTTKPKPPINNNNKPGSENPKLPETNQKPNNNNPGTKPKLPPDDNPSYI